MHPAHQDISVLIKRFLNVHKGHMVGGRPLLEIGRESTMCKKVKLSHLNGPLFFQFLLPCELLAHR